MLITWGGSADLEMGPLSTTEGVARSPWTSAYRISVSCDIIVRVKRKHDLTVSEPVYLFQRQLVALFSTSTWRGFKNKLGASPHMEICRKPKGVKSRSLHGNFSCIPALEVVDCKFWLAVWLKGSGSLSRKNSNFIPKNDLPIKPVETGEVRGPACPSLYSFAQ